MVLVVLACQLLGPGYHPVSHLVLATLGIPLSCPLGLTPVLASLLLLAGALPSASAQKFKREELDFTDAETDPATGQLCITRRQNR